MKYRIIRECGGFVPQVRVWWKWYDIRKHKAYGPSPRALPNQPAAEQSIMQYKAEHNGKKKPQIVFMSSD